MFDSFQYYSQFISYNLSKVPTKLLIVITEGLNVVLSLFIKFNVPSNNITGILPMQEYNLFCRKMCLQVSSLS